ncbi:DUF2163 domain-containing protein [Citreimonas salinaria]|uniref:Bacteriophage phiJL001 Gp84 C-terminal domain-containing protein n=1 Tax=Citreimonas salinaria TaxID=321339 RepID=A0A1H3GYV9_9RHOB|nr:DUF2163 domain-containing protein [Citreimonas salinaria]SDY08307.1 phage conserved hypothetical protein BR0599 [Citreimonas salinaria]
MPGVDALHRHLATGSTSVARAWAVTRTDGVRFGFTDHDMDLAFDGLVFRADTGLSARALQQATGLSVDNTEAMGALSDSAIREADIAAGRFDGAEVTAWLVNWADVSARRVMFRGHIGEIRRGAGAFHAELRGLTDALNRPMGRAYQKPCSAVLGNADCRFDMSKTGYRFEGVIASVTENRVFDFGMLPMFELGWFQRGCLRVVDGDAAGLGAGIKRDRIDDSGKRLIEISSPLRAQTKPGDRIVIEAGCDKRFETCCLKFANQVNFRGFPDLPEEDWMVVSPAQAKRLGGGSRR